MAHDVFISHAHEDKSIADAACATLEQEGIRCWIAPRDLRAGVDWGTDLVENIKSSRILVVVLSGSANTSRHIPREVERAVDLGIPVLPLRIEDVLPLGALEYHLRSVHWLDAMTPPLEGHLKQLARTVRTILANAPGDGQPTPVHATVISSSRTGDSHAEQITAPRRRPSVSIAVAAIALALALSAWFGLRNSSGEEPAEDRAVFERAQRLQLDGDKERALAAYKEYVALSTRGENRATAQSRIQDLERDFQLLEPASKPSAVPPGEAPVAARSASATTKPAIDPKPSAPVTERVPSPVASASSLNAFAGDYDFGTFVSTVSIRDDVLTLAVPGQRLYPLEPTDDHAFAFKDLPGFSAEFRPNSSAAVNALFVRQPPAQGNILGLRRSGGQPERSVLALLAGQYDAGAVKVTVTLREDGILTYFVPDGQPLYELRFANGLHFAIKGVHNTSIEFNRDAAGKVTHLISHQINGSFVARRVTN